MSISTTSGKLSGAFKAEKQSASNPDVPEAPVGVPEAFEDHIKLMFDLQVLAYQAEITRISTMMCARDTSSATYPGSGVRDGFHTASHHSNARARMVHSRSSIAITCRCSATSSRSPARHAGWRRQPAGSLGRALRRQHEQRAASTITIRCRSSWLARIGTAQGRSPSPVPGARRCRT